MVKSYEENAIYYWPSDMLPQVTEGFFWESLGAGNYVYKRNPVNNHYKVGAEIYVPNHKIGTPPVNDPNLYWEQVNHNADGRHYVLREHKIGKREGYRTDEEYETLRKQYAEAMIKTEILSDEVKLNHTLAGQHHEEFLELQREHRNCEDMRQGGLEQNKKLQEQADKFRVMYHEERRAKENLQKELGEVCVKAANMQGELETLYEGNRKLMNEKARETDKECEMAEQSPEAKVYEDMHTRRMAAETESVELDNLRKRAEINGYKDYPHSSWEYLRTNLDKTVRALRTRTVIFYGAAVAFIVNEVIQWLTR